MKDIYNSTRCEMTTENGGTISVVRPEIGTMINVHGENGLSERMLVAYFEGNRIICDNDGIEACIILALDKINNVLYWKDVTD